MSNKMINIPGRLHSVATDGQVVGAAEVFDDEKGKTQSQINSDIDESIAAKYAKVDDINERLQTVEQLAEISVEGGSIGIATASDFDDPTAEQKAKVPTVGALLDGADSEPTAGSDNLVKSGGVFNSISEVNQGISSVNKKVSGLSKKVQGLSLGVNPSDELIYIYINGKPVGDGVESVDVEIRYAITWKLISINSTSWMPSIAEGKSLSATLIAETGYEIEQDSVKVTMGGVDITFTAYSNNTISIPSVTGNVEISATANIIPSSLLNVTWANHAITCGQDTNNYNAWCPHNLQYDFINKCYVFLQCHAHQHLSAVYTNWTLSVINPYDPNDYIDIPIPTFNGLGMLFIEGGVWYLMPRGGSSIYRSDDMGNTWETIPANIPAYLFGVYKCGNKYFGGNDSNSEITYYESDDLLTWETKSFDSTLGYNILCETSFCEYDGKWWAFNRTNNSTLGHPVILQSTDKGATWTLFSDQMLHGYRSTIACLPFSDCLIVADIDRDNGYLYYNKFNGSTFEQLNSWKVPKGGDDFHNVNVVSDYEETIVIAFMHSVPGYETTNNGVVYSSQMACDNVMLVGSTKSLPSVGFNYIDSMNDVIDYFNANCTSGINSERTYSYQLRPNTNKRIACYFDSVNGFEDEIPVPNNLLCFRGSALGATIKYKNKFVKAWSNDVNAPGKSSTRFTIYSTSSEAFVNIGRHRYTLAFEIGRFDVLPILTRQDYLVEIDEYTGAANEVSVINKSWQENLEFRRVISVSNYSGDSTYLDIFFYNSVAEGEHALALVDYTPAM